MGDLIDNDVLISLVEARPVLWDKTLDTFKDRDLTRDAWREVCCALKNDFEVMEDKEKMHLNASKLRHLRDALYRIRWIRTHKNVKATGTRRECSGTTGKNVPQTKNGAAMDLCTSMLLLSMLESFPLPTPCDVKDPFDREMNAVLGKTKRLIEAGNLDVAEDMLEKALAKSKRANSVWSNILLLLLGKIALKKGQHPKSEKYYMELVQNLSGFLETTPAVERLRLWASIDLAQLYSETNEIQKAEQHYNYSLFTLEAMSVGANDFHWAIETLHHILDGYSELLVTSGRYDEALAQREKAHNLCQTIYGEKHIKLVRSLNELGRIYTYKGEDEKAISFFDQAIKMCHALDSVDPMELAALLVNSGRVHLRRGLVKTAKENCEKALGISDKANNQLGQAHAKDCLEGVRNAMKS